jgi:Entner-Doudoroff aldolase
MYDSGEVLAFFERVRCSAILRTPRAEAVAPAMQAAVDGGFRAIEFTLTTPNALEHIAEFAAQDGLLVGAGTVLDVEQVDAVADAGARFVVSPVVDEEVLARARELGLLTIPGCYSPTEMMRAHEAGADLVKLFPGPADGPGFVRACLGPMPFLKIFPTGGVTLENACAHLDAGAFGVGFVTPLFEPEDLAAGRFDAVRARAEEMIAAVRATDS